MHKEGAKGGHMERSHCCYQSQGIAVGSSGGGSSSSGSSGSPSYSCGLPLWGRGGTSELSATSLPALVSSRLMGKRGRVEESSSWYSLLPTNSLLTINHGASRQEEEGIH